MRTRDLFTSRMPVLFLLMSFLLPHPAEAQLLKKLFKKKNKAPVEQVTAAPEPEQSVMVAVDALADHTNNRNGFLGLPIGIGAGDFERRLLEKGFTEMVNDEQPAGKTYMYGGEVLGRKATVRLALTERTGRVYAVGTEFSDIYADEAQARKAFNTLKDSLTQQYGKGYVDEGGSAYRVMTRLGGAELSYERLGTGGGYSIGMTVDDAKAYALAYDEMEDKEHEDAPRTTENGLAGEWHHTGLVSLGTLLMEKGTLQQARTLLKTYDYRTGRETAKLLPATMAMGTYSATASVGKKGKSISMVTLTANDDAAALENDLLRYGYVKKNATTFSNGKINATLGKDKQGRNVVKMTRLR